MSSVKLACPQFGTLKLGLLAVFKPARANLALSCRGLESLQRCRHTWPSMAAQRFEKVDTAMTSTLCERLVARRTALHSSPLHRPLHAAPEGQAEHAVGAVGRGWGCWRGWPTCRDMVSFKNSVGINSPALATGTCCTHCVSRLP